MNTSKYGCLILWVGASADTAVMAASASTRGRGASAKRVPKTAAATVLLY